jgi:hypothetical protein
LEFLAYYIFKIKVFGSRIKVDSVAKVAELEQTEKDKMKEKVCQLICLFLFYLLQILG